MTGLGPIDRLQSCQSRFGGGLAQEHPAQFVQFRRCPVAEDRSQNSLQ